MFESLELAVSNLTSPPVLAFVLGLIAVGLRSRLEIPPQIFSALSIYLLLAIGIKGGVGLRMAEPADIAAPIALAIIVGLAIPVAAFAVLKVLTPLNQTERGAIAAHYGSTSLVTFTAGLMFVESLGLDPEGYLATLLAIMEVPGLIVGLVLARKASKQQSWGPLMHEVLTGKSILLLVGGLVIGAVSGPVGYERVEPFFGALFVGVLTLFLLQLGIQAGSHLKELPQAGWGLLIFAIAFPLVIGIAGVGLATLIGLSAGGAAVFGVLCASASYIAAPAAVKLSLPEANPGFYLTASLGITFPFNLLIGIPVFVWFAQLIS
ncbi:sodium-dependent bicarbonate transport family permease [Aurantimicrobium sp. INA4]|uniref:sodium-dependent bicarbonate transport family permease n=1 Tax=Aurantimicrobium sp. INA4 TaxID=2986279 RepID=UPI002490BF85|nr:sodium-dependent bicarbonate transport family permease [Aurantimicrobium sp. INA4]BDU11455.1 sodium-dependent bicarbonate transport family permease [Aurantimicrobium sp. INA4]